MNRIALVLFLLVSMMIFSACGQYGPLYAPTEEVTPEQTEDPEKQQEKQ
ncbi:MAG: lipoprotein [Gammaproteobacteria bacterium]